MSLVVPKKRDVAVGHKEKKSKVPTVEDVRALEVQLMSGPEHANKVITLTKTLKGYMRRRTPLTVAMSCMHALRRFFIKQAENGMISRAAQPDDDSATSTDPSKLFKRWNRKQYLGFIDVLLTLMTASLDINVAPEKELQLRVLSLRSIMELVTVEHYVTGERAGTFGNLTFKKMLRALVRRGCATNDIIQDALIDVLITEYICAFDDVPLYTLRCLRDIMTQGLDRATTTETTTNASSEASSPASIPMTFTAPQSQACFKILSKIESPGSESDLRECPEMLCAIPEDETLDAFDTEEADGRSTNSQSINNIESLTRTLGSTGRRPKKKQRSKQSRRSRHPALKLKNHRAALDGAWKAFLRLKSLPRDLVRTLLFSMSTDILPRLEHPLMLSDFLTAALDYGGMIGVVAIHGLFLLVNEHGLDYPDFYERLYSLLTPQVFLSKYRRKFFNLMWLFLRSPNLSASLVAAFCKRTARLALTAPPHGVVFAVGLIFNLLQRHRACRVLVDATKRRSHIPDNKNTSDSDDDSSSNTDENERDGESRIKTKSRKDEPHDSRSDTAAALLQSLKKCDPFKMDEINFNKSNAMASSLWELKSLESHYCGTIASLSTAFDMHLDNPKFSLRMEEISGLDYAQLIEQKTKKVHKNRDRKAPSGGIAKRRRGRRQVGNDDGLDDDEDHSALNMGAVSVRVVFEDVF